jgi:hypothetical protein
MLKLRTTDRGFLLGFATDRPHHHTHKFVTLHFARGFQLLVKNIIPTSAMMKLLLAFALFFLTFVEGNLRGDRFHHDERDLKKSSKSKSTGSSKRKFVSCCLLMVH